MKARNTGRKSSITSEEQKQIAEAYIQQLDAAKVFRHPIVTKVAPLQAFYRAEDYHQDYVQHNPHQPYVAYNDLPKLTNLRAEFPEMCKSREIAMDRRGIP